MQKGNKVLNNIGIYLCSDSCLKKNWFHYLYRTHGTPNANFSEDATILFKKCEGSTNSKHDNFAHLNGTRLHHWRRTYWTLKHLNLCSDEAIDKTELFWVNQLALTRIESKFCIRSYGMKCIVCWHLWKPYLLYQSSRWQGGAANVSFFSEITIDDHPEHWKSSSILMV